VIPFWEILLMRRSFVLVVLAGLLLSVGCGKDKRVEAPTNTPPPPKGRPTMDGKGSNQSKTRDISTPIAP
jgi:hypothetical protein